MLTPTNVTAAVYNAAVKADARSHIKMTFISQNIVLTDEDIESNGFELKQYLNGTTDLNFGSAVMSEITVRIFNSTKVADLVWNSEFKLEIGLEIDDETTEWITLGYFTGQRPDRVRLVEIIDFTAYDRMQMFEILADDFLAEIEYPKTVSQIYSALCDYVGIENEAGNELANIMSRSFSSSPISDVGLTCRDVLSMIAEACGCYAKITAGGKCKMIWYTDQTSYSVDAQDQYNLSRFDLLSGKTWQDLESYTWEQLEQFRWEDLGGYQVALAVKGLVVKYTDDDVGVSIPENASTNLYLIVDNPFLVYLQDSDVANYFQPIFDRLDSFGGYLPMDVECVGNCLVEAGDIISVNIGDNSVKMPIFCKTLHWNGSCTDTYEATGNMERDLGTSPQRQKLTRNSKFHKYRVDIDELYSEINDPETGLKTLVNQQEDEIELLAEHKSTVYYSDTEPVGTEELPLMEGDLWINRLDNNRMKRYNGSIWVNTSFNDPNKYTVRSGIDILPIGVEIVGNKHIKLQAGDDTWEFTSKGLEYNDDNAPFPFQITNHSDRINDATGIFTEYVTGHGRLILYAVCQANAHTAEEAWYGAIDFENFDNADIVDPLNTNQKIDGNGIALHPNRSYACSFLGTQDRPWQKIYVRRMHGMTYPLSSSNRIRGQMILAPSADVEDAGVAVFVEHRYYDSSDNQYLRIGSAGTVPLYFYGTLVGNVQGYVQNASASGITDLNNLVNKGDYWVSFASMSNKPSTLSNGTYLVKVQRYSSTHIQQTIFTDSQLYTRMCYSGTWGSWYRYSGTAV